MTIDELKAYKRKAKAQRDNWKRRTMNDRKLIADYCWEKRGYFASDAAAKYFAELVLMGCWEKKQTPPHAAAGKKATPA